MESVQKKLRVGLLMDSMTVPVWVWEMLDRIHGSDYAQIELVVMNGSKDASTSIFKKIAEQWTQLPSILVRKGLWGIYNWIDRRATGYRDAFVPVDCGPMLHEIPRLQVNPVMRKFSDYFPRQDLETIREYKVDVFLRLGFRILRGRILNLPRYGIWSYHHGDNRVNRGGPAAFWEYFHQWPETGSILQILTEDLDNGELIFHSTSSTDQASFIRNKCNLYWKTMSFIPRKLEELHRDGPDVFMQRIKRRNSHPILYSNQLFVGPSNWALSGLLLKTLWTQIRSRFTSLFFFSQWCLLLSQRHELSTSLWRFQRVVPPKDRFWADPHVIFRENTYYVFIEEYIYGRGRGRIACMEVDRDEGWAQPYPVLERDYHLSYPFVFEYDGRVYMVPESCESGTIQLYECVDFPRKWEFRKVLMEGVKALDTTLHFHGGRWWLFTNLVENEGASSWDELFLFHADSPLSDRWVPHPMNPIVSDASCARPAGKLFEYNGHLYRPSQDCTTRYGYGFNLSEIKVLDEQEYAEQKVTSAYPHWDRNLLATHSFNYIEGLTVGDVLVRRSRWV